MRQQLMALRAGLHPVTGMRLPAASGSTASGSGTYSRLKPVNGGCDDFVPYVPFAFGPPIPSGESAERKRWLLRGRVLLKQYREAVRLKKLRRKEAKEEVREAIRSFIEDPCEDDPMQELGNDECGEEFWLALPAMDCRTSHIQNIPTQPVRNFLGKTTQVRVLELNAGCKYHAKDD